MSQTATAIISNRLTPTQIKQRICEYHEASRPFIKILVDLKNTQLTKMTLFPNGKLEIQYTEEYHRLKKQIDESLEFLKNEIFGTSDYNKEYWRKYGIPSASLNPLTGNLRL